jgi:preprotein translocase subunit SecG
MYIFLIVLILVASLLMVLAVLVQNPKSGMASNFGASNQVMGVRQTADFLEKFTWGAAATVLALSLLSVVFIENNAAVSNVETDQAEIANSVQTESDVNVPQTEVPAE